MMHERYPEINKENGMEKWKEERGGYFCEGKNGRLGFVLVLEPGG